MEGGEIFARGRRRSIHVHGVVHAIAEDELVGERHPPWFHGMATTKVDLFDFGVGVEGNGIAFGTSDLGADGLLETFFVGGEGRGV